MLTTNDPAMFKNPATSVALSHQERLLRPKTSDAYASGPHPISSAYTALLGTKNNEASNLNKQLRVFYCSQVSNGSQNVANCFRQQTAAAGVRPQKAYGSSVSNNMAESLAFNPCSFNPAQKTMVNFPSTSYDFINSSPQK